MAKFHINKHGVPAPCRAKKGNCPYGGSENHYDTMEEAQSAIDQKSEMEYGLLPSQETKEPTLELTLNAKIDDDNFLNLDPYDNHGYIMTGVHTSDFLDTIEYDESGVGQELWDKLPDKWKEGHTIIPEKNVKTFFEHHVFSPYSDEFDKDNYSMLSEEVIKRSPELYNKDTGLIDRDLESHMSEFAAKKEMENPSLTINGQKFMVADYKSHNWAKDYFDSGEFENFKK
mgnify:CR=1 FL=1